VSAIRALFNLNDGTAEVGHVSLFAFVPLD